LSQDNLSKETASFYLIVPCCNGSCAALFHCVLVEWFDGCSAARLLRRLHSLRRSSFLHDSRHSVATQPHRLSPERSTTHAVVARNVFGGQKDVWPLKTRGGQVAIQGGPKSWLLPNNQWIVLKTAD